MAIGFVDVCVDNLGDQCFHCLSFFIDCAVWSNFGGGYSFLEEFIDAVGPL